MTNQIRISRSGENALTETDPNKFIFHSAYNTFKIVDEISIFPNLADTGGYESSFSWSHNQPYTPFVFAFCKFGFFSGDKTAGPGTRAPGGVNFWFTRLSVNSTYIVFKYINDTGGDYLCYIKYLVCEVPL